MAKRILAWMLTAVLFLAACPSVSATAEQYTEGYYTYTVTDGEATITGVKDGLSGEVVLPATLGGYPVTAIGRDAFSKQKQIESLVLPSTLTTIGAGAFRDCKALSAITIPPSLVSVGDSAFRGDKIAAVYITDIAAWCRITFEDLSASPASIFYANLNVYLNGELVTNLVIPDGISELKPYVFNGWRALISVDIPSSVRKIGVYAFRGCTSLTSLEIPDSVTEIEGAPFDGCAALASLRLPQGIKEIPGMMAFGAGLRSIRIPDSVETIFPEAFSSCSLLKEVFLPRNVKRIGAGAFEFCDAITDVWYGGNATDRERMDWRYGGNESLMGAVWHYNTCAGEHTYTGVCDDTCEVCEYARAAEERHTFDTPCDGECNVCGNTRETSHVWESVCDALCDICGETRQRDHVWDNACDTQCNACMATRETVHVIVVDPAVAAGCTTDGLTEGAHCGVCHAVLTAQEAVAALGHVYDSAADETCNVCGDIRYYSYEVSDGKAVITAVSREIAGEVTLPATLDGYPVTAVGADAFRGCTGITSLAIPSAVETIGEGAFDGCTDLQSVYWNAVDCAVVSDAAKPLFAACENLRYVHIASGVKRVPAYAFIGTPITAVSFATGVECVGDYAFSGCAALRSVTLPQGVLTVGEGAFRGCSAVETVILPDSLQTIGSYAFMSCKGVREITVGRGLRTVGYAAFLDCAALSSVRYNGTLTMRAAVQCGSDNTPFVEAQWHYTAPKGDVDGNGKVDSTDARLVLQYAVKKISVDALDTTAADVDGSGAVDSTDARLILQYAVKKIDKFA